MMSYRVFLGEMPRDEYLTIRSMNSRELIQHYPGEDVVEDDGSFYRSVDSFGKLLFNFGSFPYSYTGEDAVYDKKFLKPLFEDEKVWAKYNEDTPIFVAKPDFLRHRIMKMRDDIAARYEELIQPFAEKGRHIYFFGTKFEQNITTPNKKIKLTEEEAQIMKTLLAHIRLKMKEWMNGSMPFSLDEGSAVTTSSLKEYDIFELVRIYKTFDSSKNILIYYGH